jgi:hypothetical protein
LPKILGIGTKRLANSTQYRLIIADTIPVPRRAAEAVAGLFTHAEIGEAGSFDEVANCSNAAKSI